MITVRIDDKTYTMPSASEPLAALTGDESLMVEEYLGGWDQLGQKLTKSAVVMVWLALKQAGEPRTFEEIQTIPGLTFGGVIEDDGVGEPEDPMKDPGRPLAAPNGSNGLTAGSEDSEAIQATSASSGTPA